MKTKLTQSGIASEVDGAFSWMRQRTSEELNLFIERRLATVKDVVID